MSPPKKKCKICNRPVVRDGDYCRKHIPVEPPPPTGEPPTTELKGEINADTRLHKEW